MTDTKKPATEEKIIDLLDQRIHAASMAMMAQMQSDMDGNSAICLVFPLYNNIDETRQSLRLLTVIDGKKTETYLNGSYRTYKAARKAANFVEAAARVMLRQLRPISMAGAEQAIGWTQTDYSAKIGLSIPSEDGKVQPL